MNDENEKTLDFMRKFGVRVTVGSPVCKKHFPDDCRARFVFPVTISRGGKRMRVAFGQSYADGARPPAAYEVLSAMVKHDPGTFELFCRDYGLDKDGRNAERTWKACAREWAGVVRVFGDEGDPCLRGFQEIV